MQGMHSAISAVIFRCDKKVEFFLKRGLTKGKKSVRILNVRFPDGLKRTTSKNLKKLEKSS